jgi:hypothetical protein
MLKEARAQAASARITAARSERQEQAAAGRPVGGLPRGNAEWNPIVQNIDEVLGVTQQSLPPLRDAEHDPGEPAATMSPGLHLLTSEESNPDDDGDEEE